MTRLTRCDICGAEIPPGRNGYRLEVLDNALSAPDTHGYWDLCGIACLTALGNRLTAREAAE